MIKKENYKRLTAGQVIYGRPCRIAGYANKDPKTIAEFEVVAIARRYVTLKELGTKHTRTDEWDLELGRRRDLCRDGYSYSDHDFHLKRENFDGNRPIDVAREVMAYLKNQRGIDAEEAQIFREAMDKINQLREDRKQAHRDRLKMIGN